MSIDIETLKTVCLFQALKVSDLLWLCSNSAERIALPNEMIYRAGESGQTVFVTLNGKIRLFVRGKYGKPIILSHIIRGGIFGELSSSPGDVCIASAVTLTDVHLLILNRENLVYIFSKSPDSALHIIAASERQLRNTYRILGTPNVRQ